MNIQILNDILTFRLADENSEELTKAITESEDIIAKLKAQTHKSIQEHPVAEAAGSCSYVPLRLFLREPKELLKCKFHVWWFRRTIKKFKRHAANFVTVATYHTYEIK